MPCFSFLFRFFVCPGLVALWFASLLALVLLSFALVAMLRVRAFRSLCGLRVACEWGGGPCVSSVRVHPFVHVRVR